MATSYTPSPKDRPDWWDRNHNPFARASDWEGDDGEYFSWHAVEMWDYRTPPDSVSPETAWEDGIELPDYLTDAEFFRDRKGRSPDQIRSYYERDSEWPYQAFLVAYDGEIFSVNLFHWIDEDDLSLRAALLVLRNGLGEGSDS